jgi:glutamate dehydrogenase (NADP+)
MSDSNGVVLDENGIDLETIKRLKEVERRRISDYCLTHRRAHYMPGADIWEIPCDVAMPSATQNEISGKDAFTMVKNGVVAVGEGANMPSTPEAVQVFLENGVLFGPGKAANAGGVATSALEMQQNACREAWTFTETDEKLHQIMRNIHETCVEAADEFGCPGNLVRGANIAGFIKVARAMIAQGLV